ncbi:MAG: GTPase ObgE [candidate division WWE3 bacterium]|nr:GTPase ObgE [candidate division WWE3 bacterium]
MVDLVTIKIKAGNGGDGVVSWHREKFRPKGGPDGGNGGDGGSIYLETDSNLLTLSDFASQRYFKADDGNRGGKNNCTGHGGADLVLKVPIGTLVYLVQPDTKTLIADLTKLGERVLIASKGIGGKGNYVFRSSTNQRPMEWTPGTAGEEKELQLELKILADAGLVGLPSAGKSTLLNTLTSAKAAVGAYPFTTLEPNLGVVIRHSGLDPESSNPQKIVLADLPGLIAGASSGKGLGDRFLRHIERCPVIVHLIAADSKDIATDYQTIRTELALWSPVLAQKTEIVVISKVDLVDAKTLTTVTKDLKKILPKGTKIVAISAQSHLGLDDLTNTIIKTIKSHIKPIEPINLIKPTQSTKIFTIENLPNKKMVFRNTTRHSGLEPESSN